MWTSVREFEDIRYETTDEGQIAKITINRPEVRNAFRPQTVKEMLIALELAHEDPEVGVIILTGEGYKAKDGVLNGVESVKSNAGDPARYEVKEANSGGSYFVLTPAGDIQ